MGLIKHFSSSSLDRDYEPLVKQTSIKKGNPNPNNYKILLHEKIGRFLIVKINYLDCTNYEGNKILMFEHVSIKDLEKQKSIDPHFSENKMYIHPIARFEPTDKGLEMARLCAKFC